MFTDLFQLEKKPVTVFSSLDTGAPILNKEPGSLKNLIKACLVTGYGDKASLGWEMPFESDDLLSAAFRSKDPTASRFYFKIDNSGATNAKLSAYQSMTGLDAGDKPIVVDNLYSLYASNWRLIGHSKAFILLLDIQHKKLKIAFPLIFGDMPRQKNRIQHICVIWCARNYYYIGSVQSTLFYHPNGTEGENGPYIQLAACYPFCINHESASQNLSKNYGRFKYDTFVAAPVLYEPVFMQINDATWTFLPWMQPCSNVVTDTNNLSRLSDNALKITSGNYEQAGNDNYDCAVPTDWWWA